MVVDSSALVAILRGEPESDAFTRAILASSSAAIAAPNLLETGIALDRASGVSVAAGIRRFIEATGLEVVPFGVEHIDAALEAYRRFGKGSGHPARLNFGDCFAYALARVRNVPLLYKGDDFAQTDVASAH